MSYRFNLEKFRANRVNQFEKLLKDKSIARIQTVNDTMIITYYNGSIFKCSGWLVENCGLKNKNRKGTLNIF
jgi:hypothetical protein